MPNYVWKGLTDAQKAQRFEVISKQMTYSGAPPEGAVVNKRGEQARKNAERDLEKRRAEIKKDLDAQDACFKYGRFKFPKGEVVEVAEKMFVSTADFVSTCKKLGRLLELVKDSKAAPSEYVTKPVEMEPVEPPKKSGRFSKKGS